MKTQHNSKPVMASETLLCGHQLVWVGNQAELRGQHSAVVATGTYRAMHALAKSKGLLRSQAPSRQ